MLIAIAQHVPALAARRQVGILNIGCVVVAAGYRRHHQRDETGEQVLVTRPLPEPVILEIETSRVCSVLPPIIAEAGNSLQVWVVTCHAPDLRPARKI